MVMMVAMIPAMLFAMYEKNGQPLEVVIRNIYRVCFQRPKQRPYKTNNFYAVLERQNQLDREVYQIVRKKKLTRAERKQIEAAIARANRTDKKRKIGAGQHPVSAYVAGRHLPCDRHALHQNDSVSGHQLPAFAERGTRLPSLKRGVIS